MEHLLSYVILVYDVFTYMYNLQTTILNHAMLYYSILFDDMKLYFKIPEIRDPESPGFRKSGILVKKMEHLLSYTQVVYYIHTYIYIYITL